ncbi:hypothetical protein Golomagni_00595 [Golovinomyces magnicellulatus]|nr:hypothetical protein Golomagni_00595 [Golovinomyces magnicellulatus]
MDSRFRKQAVRGITNFIYRILRFDLKSYRLDPIVAITNAFLGPRCPGYAKVEALKYPRGELCRMKVNERENTGSNFYVASSRIINEKNPANGDAKSNIEQGLSMKSEEHAELMPDRVRQIMRHVPQSIAILTTSFLSSTVKVPNGSGNLAPSDAKGIGMTLSSVSTVTLKPEPIISFNIKKPSHTLDALRHHGHFLIHFPSCTKSGALLADRFSRGFLQYHHEQAQCFDKSTALSILNIQGQQVSLPALLSPAYPINNILKCEVYGENGYIDVADHVIVVGKVLKTWSNTSPRNNISTTSSNAKSSHGKNSGLTYFDGSYCFTGPKFL